MSTPEAMDYDYFDDEELINDYVQEPFEPEEEEYPADFLAYMEQPTQQQPTIAGVTSRVSLPATAVSALGDDCDPPAVSGNDFDRDQENVPVQEINIQSTSETEADLYSFERYKRNNDWRKEKSFNVDSGFEVKEWRRTAPMTPAGEHGLQTTKTMTADAHLLYNDKHRHKARRNIVKVNQGGITTIPVVGSKSFTITVSGGNMFHVQLAASSSARTSPAAKRRKKSNYLLGVSMATLMGRSDTILRKAEVKAKLSSANNLPSTGDSSLWVDKHAPTAFCHLLSDEQTNRQVLRALRAWDPYVFRQAAQKLPSYYWENMETKDVESADVRPNVTSRVLLLSGPPGVGKTTLAHIVARHAGYHPVEVNASDDRSASTLKETVVRAMESSTLNFGNSEDSKPNCLILDEVDGADAKSAVASLVEIIRADIPQKGGKQKTYLRRPIIFICNHKYAPTLRPLLPYAVHFDVDPPSDARLVGRLRAILAKEQLSLDGGSSLLQHLIGGTGGDIRSCLYTLQFSAAKARQSSKVQAVDISSALKSSLQGGDGLKDARNDLVSTVTTVFKKNKKKEISDATAHMVLEAVDSFGEHSKTLECLFGNLMRIPYVDPTMERCLLAHEWLSGADRLGGSMQSLAAGAIHVLCRVETRPDLSFSTRQGSNVAYALEANRGIVQKFIEGLSPSFKTSHRLVTIETVPYALWMLSAGLGSSSLTRPVSSLDILDKPERAAFGAHVSTLRSLGLTYVAAERRDKSGVALVDMKLEPEIDRLVCFGGYIASPENRRRRIPSVLRELLAHRAQVEAIRGREAMATYLSNKGKEHSDSFAASSSYKPRELIPDNSVASDRSEKKHRPSASIALAIEDTVVPPPSKKTKINKKVTNFLGVGAQKAKAARTARKKAQVGMISTSNSVKLSHTGTGLPVDQVIRFKYQKGFTQAVKTPCRVEDLL